MLVNCEALHSVRESHDGQGALQQAPGIGPYANPCTVSPQSLGRARTKAREEGRTSDNVVFPVRELKGRVPHSISA